MAAIPGTILAAKISPGDTVATFPTHEDIYGKGGLMTVNTITDLENIYTDRQKVGMIVYVVSTSKYYNITVVGNPPTYQEFDPQGTSAGFSDLQSVYLKLSGGTITGNLAISGDLIIHGNTTTIETNVTTTSAFEIKNYGTQTALKVVQVDGNTDVVEFIDGSNTSFIIKGDGKVGINTNAPTTTLHISGTDGLVIPVGTDLQRVNTKGAIRYNIDSSSFEGYDGSNWGSLGGIKDVDGNTYISAENSPGANNNELKFFTDGVEKVRILQNGNVGIGTITPNELLTVNGNLSASNIIYGSRLELGDPSTTSTLYTENGKVGINTETPNEALTVVGNISATGQIFLNEPTTSNSATTKNYVDSSVSNLSTTIDSEITSLSSTIDLNFVNKIESDPVTLNGGLTVTTGIIVDTINSSGLVTIDNSLSGNGYSSTIYGFIIDGGSF